MKYLTVLCALAMACCSSCAPGCPEAAVPMPYTTNGILTDYWLTLGLPWDPECADVPRSVYHNATTAEFEELCATPSCDTDPKQCTIGCNSWKACGNDGTQLSVYLHGWESRRLTAHEWAHATLRCVNHGDGDPGHLTPGVWGATGFEYTYPGPQ